MKTNLLRQKFTSLIELLTLAAVSGLLAGFIEVILLGARKFMFGHAILLGARIVWMTAAANLLLFVGAGIVLATLMRFWPKLQSPRTSLAMFAFLALTGWLLLFPKIQWYASLVLATGLAVQIGQKLAKRLQPATIKLAAKLATSILILLALGCEGWLHWSEQRALAALPLPKSNAPNVLLLVMDTVGARNLSLYGYHRPTTPKLTAFAKRGAMFEAAISTAPWTAPSHAGMFTGHYPHEVSSDWEKPLDRRLPTLAETLREFGYATAGIVANTLVCGYESGLNRGFDHYDDYSPSASEFIVSSSLLRSAIHSAPLRRAIGNQEIVTRKSAAQINQSFLDWLDESPGQERPFFAFLNYFDAHEPYLPPAPFDTKFGATVATHYRARHDLRRSFRYNRERMTEQENLAEQAAYDGAIAYLDEQIGLLLDELERRNVLENTLVIVTADHGENFGEHGHFTHGDNLYLPLLHVPLLMVYPKRIPANSVISTPISLRDLPATTFDLLGIGEQQQFPGASLASLFYDDSKPLVSTVFSEVNLAPIRPDKYPADTKAVMRSIIRPPFQFIQYANGREELYDFFSDPNQRNNILNRRELNRLIEELRCQIEEAD
ncbi:MAG: sulfatase-like hydrolase/transferase [Acidobacteriota bacterium]|nr:sulfatase-like hydrolase/transferase [Acidobacteriota bacterium]